MINTSSGNVREVGVTKHGDWDKHNCTNARSSNTVQIRVRLSEFCLSFCLSFCRRPCRHPAEIPRSTLIRYHLRSRILPKQPPTQRPAPNHRRVGKGHIIAAPVCRNSPSPCFTTRTRTCPRDNCIPVTPAVERPVTGEGTYLRATLVPSPCGPLPSPVPGPPAFPSM